MEYAKVIEILDSMRKGYEAINDEGNYKDRIAALNIAINALKDLDDIENGPVPFI